MVQESSGISSTCYASWSNQWRGGTMGLYVRLPEQVQLFTCSMFA